MTGLRLTLCALALGFLPAQIAHSAASSPVTLAAIESTRAQIQAGDLDEIARETALTQLDAASADLREADKLAERLRELRSEAASQPARMKRLRQALTLDRDQAVEEWAARLPKAADAETLERVLEQERHTIGEIAAQLDAVAADLVSSLSRPAQAANDIGVLNRRIEELSVAADPIQDDATVLGEVRELRRLSELKRTLAELELRKLEQETTTNLQRLHELTLSELDYRQELHVRRVELLQARIVDQARREMESLISRLSDSAAAFADDRGIAADAARENLQLGVELIKQNEQLSIDRQALVEREEIRLGVENALRESRTRLELAGTSEAVGRWLWSERRNLESPARLAQSLERLRGTRADLRLRRVMVLEQLRALADIPAEAKAMIEARTAAADEGDEETQIEAALEPLLSERLELLTLLDPLLQRRVDALELSDRALTGQIENTLALRQLLDRHLLWAPSHARLDASWLQRVPEGIYDLIKPSRMQTTLKLSGRAIVDRPLTWAACLLLLLLAVEMRRRAPPHIEAQAAATRQIRRDSFRSTARALGWTLIAALPGPVAVFLLGQLLRSVGNPGRYSDSLGLALIGLTLPLFCVQVLRWTAIERGLGHAHFRWMRARREALRRTVPTTAAIVLPMYFIGSLAFNRNLDLPNDVQARLAIMIACGGLAWGLWHLLGAGRIWVVRGMELEPSTLRKLLRLVLPATALAVAGLALAGYVYSAGLLLITLLDSISLVVVIAITTGLLARWFLLGERKLAWNRLEEKRAAASQSAAEPGEPTVESEPDLTLEQVNAQTGRLLRALRLTLLIIGLVWIWAEILPAAARLDDIVLWHFSDIDADGVAVLQPVTLLGALLGIFVFALTTVSARNLPGLIEIGMQSYTRIDAASRYAATSILRYAIVIAGVVVGLGLFGMRWSQLQWLAAALTVGLGFGLQEIFANFVSGLILLFERPFRVGDIITVGDLSGKVTRIRTRATTILDFDNKEIVVPNKNFITGQLINWTLSDATTRVIIKVGVAYGTNPGRVHELLRKAARDNPLVLSEPEPQTWFLAFGASSLDFELRVFVAAINDRLRIQDQLNTRISELFAENDIEIAFPQLDLHVRDLPGSAAPAPDQAS